MTKALILNEEIVLYSNALERKNFQQIKSRIEEELEQIAENIGLELRTEQGFDMNKPAFKATVQIFGKVTADRIVDIKKRINEIQTKIKEIHQAKSNI